MEVLDLLERTWQHMDTGLRRALRLNDNQDDLVATIKEVKIHPSIPESKLSCD